MPRPCVYCGATQNLSREHVINDSIRTLLYGVDPEYVSSDNREDRERPNHVHYLRDVCTNCNNAVLQPYDNAAKEFWEVALTWQRGMRLTLPFNAKTYGWFVKTHCNMFRLVRDTQHYDVDPCIYEALFEHNPIPWLKLALTIDLFLEDRKPYETESYGPSQIAQMIDVAPRPYNLIRSHLRVGHWETFCYFPQDYRYDNFIPRVSQYAAEVQSRGGRLMLWHIPTLIENGSFTLEAEP